MTNLLSVIQIKNSYEAPKFSCDLCEKLFGGTSTLNRHLSDVHRPRTCDTCDSEFGNYNELKTHICQKTFKHLGNLIQHMTTHYGEKNFQCNLCDKYFTTGAVLKQHKNTHFEI